MSQSDKKETVLVLAAHNDDGIIGAGGTLAKYAKEGSASFLKLISFKSRNAITGDKIIGGSGVAFLDLKEMSFKKDAEEKKVIDVLKEIIIHEEPTKIFTHSINDTMPDHRAVHHLVMETVKDIDFKGDVYSFGVWNVIDVFHRNRPKMVVDISDTFKKKIKAFKAHKSQKNAQISLMWKIYVQDFFNGLNANCRFAEVFVKLR